jgi:hypothetical protein
LYHVTSRWNGRARIFFDDDGRCRSLLPLQDCLEHYEVILYAYTWRLTRGVAIGARIPAERVDEVVAAAYGTRTEALRAHGYTAGPRRPRPWRWRWRVRVTGLTQRDIGARYGGISSQAVSHDRKRVKLTVAPERLAALAADLLRQAAAP